mmetsp:Transcript_14822/g.25132  ORF Transcript_14822/g.25132 Transcript_14822/m.25132 type:complete len:439 (-) Transcript_14822:132-1448(-)
MSFHLSWISFFMAFFGWFALAPLMPVIKEDLGLSDSDVWVANIASVLATVFARFIVGPMCDEHGPRRLQTALMVWSGVTCMLCPLINNAGSLIFMRLIVGVAGSTFVCTQFWGSSMFASNVVGQAQAVMGGLGNLGGGVIQLFMPLMYEAMRATGATSSVSWRLALVFPAAFLLATAVAVYFFTLDSPRGDYVDLVAAGKMAKVFSTESAKLGYGDPVSWLVAGHYAANFGVELTLNNYLVTYFVDKFGLDLITAGTIAACFGLTNIFARALGGILSDYTAKTYAMRGRLVVQMTLLFSEGFFLLVFSRMDDLVSAVAAMCVFAVFVQASEGSTFSIVPFIVPEAKGAVTGVVGAGGNIGAVLCGFVFLFSGLGASDVLFVISFIVMAMAFLTPLIFLKGNHDAVFGYNPRKVTAAGVRKLSARRLTQLAMEPYLGVA